MDARQNDAPVPEGDECLELAMLFRRTSRLMARAYHQACGHGEGPGSFHEGCGRGGCGRLGHARLGHARLGHAQEHVLSIVLRRGSVTQAELMAMLDVRSASLSEILAKLERAGRIMRERNPEDRRGFVISPAPGELGQDGLPKVLESDADSRASAQRLFGVLDEAERSQLRALLEKLAAPLGDAESERRGPGRGPGHGHGRGFGRGRSRNDAE
jgi:DNA-binding MarR family transcriptional regulator